MIETYKNNIRKYWRTASETEIEAGLDWYKRANRFARQLSRRYDIEFDLICRVIAVLSPRLSWTNNKIDAENIVITWKRGNDPDNLKTFALGANKTKAFEILDGDISRLRGPKVTRFYDNIKNADVSTEVTVDIHAYRVAIDNPELEYDTNIPAKELDITRQAYSEVARELDLLPHQLQAVVWLVLKSGRRQFVDYNKVID